MENPNKDKQCPVCSKRNASLTAAQRHIRKKHPGCTEAPIILSQGAFIIPGPQVSVEAPKPPKKKKKKKKICKLCPHSPVFSSKAARKQHVEAVHATKCPICPTSLTKRPLAEHLLEVHGITSGVSQVTHQTGPQFPSNSAPTEPSNITYLSQASGEVGGRIDEPPEGNGNPVPLNIHDLPLGRFYCEEYDCGRGFSSKAHLDSHTMFFHPKKLARSAERAKEAPAPSNDISNGDERPIGNPPAYLSPTSTANSPYLGKLATEGSSGHFETSWPVFWKEGDQGVEPGAENDAQEKLGGPPEPSNDISDGDERSIGHSPVYFSPMSDANSPHLGGLVTEGSSGHFETNSPVFRQEGDWGAEPGTEDDVQDKLGGPPEPPATTGARTHMAQVITTPMPLSLLCRMCGAPPTTNTRPTVTTCGHLFCSECITQRVMSTSRCPLCDNALLLYCLFKLDLPVLP